MNFVNQSREQAYTKSSNEYMLINIYKKVYNHNNRNNKIFTSTKNKKKQSNTICKVCKIDSYPLQGLPDINNPIM